MQQWHTKHIPRWKRFQLLSYCITQTYLENFVVVLVYGHLEVQARELAQMPTDGTPIHTNHKIHSNLTTTATFTTNLTTTTTTTTTTVAITANNLQLQLLIIILKLLLLLLLVLPPPLRLLLLLLPLLLLLSPLPLSPPLYNYIYCYLPPLLLINLLFNANEFNKR